MLKEEPQKCLFKTELVLEGDALCFEPAQPEFHTTIGEILVQFQACSRAVPNLLPDSFFHSFTRSLQHTLFAFVCTQSLECVRMTYWKPGQ